MLYDIASKRLAQLAPASFLSFLLQSPIDPATKIEDLPQEMPALNRADQVWRVTSPGTEPCLVLSEFQTHWDVEKKLDTALYTFWLKKRHRLRVTPVVLLCLPNQNADELYQDENCVFRFRLLKASEMDARGLFDSGQLNLYPLLPLMRGGLELVEQAGRCLYESSLERSVKGDLLALLGLFLGLTNREAAATLIWKRTDLMNVLAESPVYKEIREEGRKQGREEGREQGREQGRQEGLRNTVRIALELRFGNEGVDLSTRVDRCTDASLSRALEAIRIGRPLDEVRQILA